MSTNTDVDAIFDLASDEASTGPDTTVTAQTDTEQPTKGLYPNIAETFSAADFGDRNDDGLNAAYLQVSQFASYLSIRNIQSGDFASDLEGAMVKDNNVYAALKATRHPLPVVLVFADDVDPSAYTTEEAQKSAKVYLNKVVAEAAWDERPVRGSGGTTVGSRRSDEDLLKVAGQKRAEVAGYRARLAVLNTKLEKGEKHLARYGDELTRRGLSWEKVDEFESNAEASKEITDNATPSA